MDMDHLYSQLIPIEGLDIWEGLVHVGCNREVYADALRLFCVDLENKIDSFVSLPEQENWKEYLAAVHAAKGGLAGIGAWKLNQKVRELEDAAKKGDYGFCRKASAEVFGELKKMISSIRSTGLFSKETKPREQVSGDFLEKKLKELYQVCSSGNSIEADALARELKTKTCGGETDALVETICNHVENLDYHLVLQILVEQPYMKN